MIEPSTESFSMRCYRTKMERKNREISRKCVAIESNVISYLNTIEELTNYSLRGFMSKFTGNFVSISKKLEDELTEHSPDYKFYIAKILVSIDIPARNYALIIDVNSEEIKGHLWAEYALIHHRLREYLMALGLCQRKDAIERVESFAILIAFNNNDRIGYARIESGKAKVESIKEGGVFSILEVEIDRRLRLGRLISIQPNGKKIKYFI